jgi:hypothetical protein
LATSAAVPGAATHDALNANGASVDASLTR